MNSVFSLTVACLSVWQTCISTYCVSSAVLNAEHTEEECAH